MLPEISTLARLEQLDAQTISSRSASLNCRRSFRGEESGGGEEETGGRPAIPIRRQRKGTPPVGRRYATAADQAEEAEGAVRTASSEAQVTAFEHEIQFNTSEISKAEDRVLELMEQSETLEPQIKVEQAALAAAQKAGLEHFKAAEQQHKAGMAQIAQNAASVKELVAALDPKYAQLYERLRKK